MVVTRTPDVNPQHPKPETYAKLGVLILKFIFSGSANRWLFQEVGLFLAQRR